MTSQPLECVYWFRTYQIDNSESKVLDYDFKVRYENYNAEIVSRLLLGDKSDPQNLEDIKNLIGTDKMYEIVTFKQKTNNGTLNKSDDSRCIYSLIMKKKTAGEYSADQFDALWLAVFCPTKVCSGVACGKFNIWKVNIEGIPNTKLLWDHSNDKYCIVTSFKGNGDKAVIGVIGKQGSAKFYLSTLSFYLEGRHEDILKRFPSGGYTSGINIYYLQTNLEDLDTQP